MISKAGFRGNAALTLVALALIGSNILRASAQEGEAGDEKLQCKGDAIVATTGYDGLARGSSAEEALKRFLDETYPSVNEDEFETESTDASKPEEEKKRMSIPDKKAVAYASEEGERFVLEAFAACAGVVEGSGQA